MTCVSHETPKPTHIGHFFHLSIIRCPPKRTSPSLKEDICVSVLVPVIVRFYRPFRVQFLPGISCAPRGEYLKREPTLVIDCFIPDSKPEVLTSIRNRTANVDTRLDADYDPSDFSKRKDICMLWKKLKS